MIPDTSFDTIISECADTPNEIGKSHGAVTNCIPKLAMEAPLRSHNLTVTTSSYLHRIPSLSRQWENYRHDMVETKFKRSRRIQWDHESINDFLERFSLDENV